MHGTSSVLFFSKLRHCYYSSATPRLSWRNPYSHRICLFRSFSNPKGQGIANDATKLQIRERNDFSLDLLSKLNTLSNSKQFKLAEDLFQQYISSTIRPNIKYYNVMIKCAGLQRDAQKMLKLMEEIRNRGLKPDVVTYNTIINMLGKSEDMKGMMDHFHRMSRNHSQ